MQMTYGTGYAPPTAEPAVFDEQRAPRSFGGRVFDITARIVTFGTIVLVIAFGIGDIFGIASVGQLWEGLQKFISFFEGSGRRGSGMDWMVPIFIVVCFFDTGATIYKSVFGAYRKLEIDRAGVTLQHTADRREYYPWEFLAEIDHTLGHDWLVASHYPDGRAAAGNDRPRIALSQFDREWRRGQIGALIWAFAPRLLQPKSSG